MNREPRTDDRWTGFSLHAGGALVIALVAGGFYLSAYRPLVSQRVEHTQRIEQLDILIRQSHNVQKEHRRLRKEMAQVQSLVAATRSRLPQEALEAEFVIEASNIAKQVGLQVVNYHQERGSSSSTHSKTEVRFTCRGSYASACRFLKGVSQLARLTKVSKLDMQSGTDSESYPFQVTFVLYYGVESFDTKQKEGIL